MKRILWALVLLCLLSSLASCRNAKTNEELETEVATLSEIIEKERAERDAAALDYETRIKELELQLSVLTGETPSEGDDDGERLTFTYQVMDGKAIITKYNGTATLVTIPAVLDGYTVTAIGERAFEGCSVTAVVVPEGVVDIGWFAFYGCTSLLNVTLPASLRSIGYAVFDGCENVTLACPAGSYAEQYARAYGMPLASTP